MEEELEAWFGELSWADEAQRVCCVAFIVEALFPLVELASQRRSGISLPTGEFAAVDLPIDAARSVLDALWTAVRDGRAIGPPAGLGAFGGAQDGAVGAAHVILIQLWHAASSTMPDHGSGISDEEALAMVAPMLDATRAIRPTLFDPILAGCLEILRARALGESDVREKVDAVLADALPHRARDARHAAGGLWTRCRGVSVPARALWLEHERGVPKPSPRSPRLRDGSRTLPLAPRG